MLLASLILIALVVGLNLAVTAAVVRNEDYEPEQKRLQILAIWLLPVIGAVFIWYVIREESLSDKYTFARGIELDALNYPDRHDSHSSHSLGESDGGD